VSLAQVFAVGFFPLDQIGYGVQPESVDAAVQPKLHDLPHLFPHGGVVIVQIRLMAEEPVPVIRPGNRIPGPVREFGVDLSSGALRSLAAIKRHLDGLVLPTDCRDAACCTLFILIPRPNQEVTASRAPTARQRRVTIVKDWVLQLPGPDSHYTREQSPYQRPHWLDGLRLRPSILSRSGVGLGPPKGMAQGL